MVLGVCRRVLQDVHDAEDAFQATFLVFLRKAASIVPREFVGNWLYGVAYRTALKARSTVAKRRMKESRVRDMAKGTSNEPDVWHDLQPILDRELARLPDHYRLPIVLCDLEGKSRKEVAGQLGWPEGTLSGRLARARTMLARRLARHGLALSGGALAATLTQNAATAGVPVPLAASVVKAAALANAGGTLGAGVVSSRVAALAEGVLKGMLLSRLKIAIILLLIVAGLGLGAGFSNMPPAVDKGTQPGDSAKLGARTTKSPDRLKDFGKLIILSGRVVGVSPDRTRLTLELTPRQKGQEPRHVEISLSARTDVTYFGIGSEGARPTRDYLAKVWLQEGSAATAVRLRFEQDPSKKPDLSYVRVAGVAKGGRGITLSLPSRPIKGQKKAPEKQIAIRFTDTTVLTFSNVGPGGARPSAAYYASVWLARGSQDTAAAVLFDGGKEAKKKKRIVDSLGDRPPDFTGTVMALSHKGQRLAVEVVPPKAERWKEPQRIDIKLDAKTETVYAGVGTGGARPVEGYRAQVWLKRGSGNQAARLHFVPIKRKKQRLAGKVTRFSEDGRTLTLEVELAKKARGARRMDVKITPQTHFVYNNVGPGGARPCAGYRAQAVLQEGSTDTAESIIMEKTVVK
jgi:RNA polymerase sigma factor (sigma-70 family)